MKNLHVTYTQEILAHSQAIEKLNAKSFGAARFTRAAFLLREHCGHDLALSLVAFVEGKIIGSVRQTKIAIGRTPALLLGPLVVDEHYKNIGIGRQLLHRAMKEATTSGHHLIMLVGDESYYGRFGFRPVKPGQIILPAPADPRRLLICQLQEANPIQAAGRVQPINCVRLDIF